MGCLITVRPTGLGWLIECDAFANGLTFRSGAEAERAARSLAESCAKVGKAADVQIYLRDGSLAGCFRADPASLALAS